MVLEIDVEPLAARRPGSLCCSGHQLGADASPAGRAGHDRVEALVGKTSMDELKRKCRPRQVP